MDNKSSLHTTANGRSMVWEMVAVHQSCEESYNSGTPLRGARIRWAVPVEPGDNITTAKFLVAQLQEAINIAEIWADDIGKAWREVRLEQYGKITR